jgi:hypothetical protein
MRPDWLIPVIFLASESIDVEQNLHLAIELTRSAEERQWVSDFRENNVITDDMSHAERVARQTRLAEIGVGRRKASAVLQEAKLDLAKNWRRIAGSSSGN